MLLGRVGWADEQQLGRWRGRLLAHLGRSGTRCRDRFRLRNVDHEHDDRRIVVVANLDLIVKQREIFDLAAQTIDLNLEPMIELADQRRELHQLGLLHRDTDRPRLDENHLHCALLLREGDEMKAATFLVFQ